MRGGGGHKLAGALGQDCLPGMGFPRATAGVPGSNQPVPTGIRAHARLMVHRLARQVVPSLWRATTLATLATLQMQPRCRSFDAVAVQYRAAIGSCCSTR